MSSSPSSSRGSARSTSQRPSTPDQTRPAVKRTNSASVAPKSEYLRNALQARRAQNTPTPSPLDMRLPPPASKPYEVKPKSTSPDLFAEFALSEEQTAPVSPIRRRGPGDIGPPRSKTSRELTKEIETLKDNLMTSNMRVELLKKNNSDLQHCVTELKEQVEELQPLEEENNELRVDNNHYKLKMQDMEDEVAQLKDENDDLRKSNEEMLAINVECSLHWENQELAVQEAADTIIALETEKAALAVEVHKLKERVSALEDNGSSIASTLVDGSQRCPSIVYSIDEARPSTSHFDSDYYSQPDSPQIKNSRESIISITPSERSKKFLDLTQEHRRSARDLAKRMSAASLKALRLGSPSPAPAVPQVPVMYQQQIPRIVEQVATDRRSSRTPKRYRDRAFPQQPLLDALEMSPNTTGAAGAVSPRSPTHQSDGLRGAEDTAQMGSEEWASMPPPPVPTRSSLVSVSDLTSEVDASDKDRWWRSIDRLNQPATSQQPIIQFNAARPIDAQPQQPQLPLSPTLTRSKSHAQTLPDTPGRPARQDASGIFAEWPRSVTRSDARATRTQPGTPATTPYAERDVLFNGSEDADTFLRKLKGARR
ncbi:hypothetical protein CC86DRAFT_283667 [Ophiobolus disseminans]|uniref:Uncharacterized protein n=1 Tax=Ophiobolus disseminans TaxID=1469910 RepID=A0A6A7ABA5_9PLEO|nr:hypothetical protein CC86DRAFT_283667 [Ophiobolus disseminans]